MKKILLLTSELPPQPGGIGTHAHQLATYLSKRHRVSVVADMRSGKGDEEADFDQEQAYQIHRIQRFRLLLITYLWRMINSIKLAKSADQILVSGKFSLWQVLVLKVIYPKKQFIGIIHGTEVSLPRNWERKLTNQALQQLDVVIAVSSYTLGLVQHLHLKKTKVIPNGIVNPLATPFCPFDGEITTDLNLITVGNLTQRKGQHNMIKALPKLVLKFPNLIYHIVGIPSNKEKTIQLAQELGVEKHIHLHGRVSEARKVELLQQSHIFVMLSETTTTGDVEGFGIAILEANNKSLPAIGSLNSGIQDAIKSSYSGELVDPHQESEIVTAIDKIVQNYPVYRQQAYEWSKQFDWERIVKEYEAVMNRILKD